MRDFIADLFEVGTVDRVGGVDPAVCIKDVLWDILGVDAVDRVADILSRRHNEAEGQQDHHRDGVVQPEDGRVDVDVADFDQVLETAEYVQHGGRSRCRSIVRGFIFFRCSSIRSQMMRIPEHEKNKSH